MSEQTTNSQESADGCAPKTRVPTSDVAIVRSSPEIVDHELLAIATRIASKVLTLSPVAATAGELMIDRLVLGHQRYGAPDLDGRDWEWERDQEILDRANYVELIQVARRYRERRPVELQPRAFDVSDVETQDEPTLPPASASFDVVDGNVSEVLR